jgi:hypothetical protein
MGASDELWDDQLVKGQLGIPCKLIRDNFLASLFNFLLVSDSELKHTSHLLSILHPEPLHKHHLRAQLVKKKGTTGIEIPLAWIRKGCCFVSWTQLVVWLAFFAQELEEIEDTTEGLVVSLQCMSEEVPQVWHGISNPLDQCFFSRSNFEWQGMPFNLACVKHVLGLMQATHHISIWILASYSSVRQAYENLFDSKIECELHGARTQFMLILLSLTVFKCMMSLRRNCQSYNGNDATTLNAWLGTP